MARIYNKETQHRYYLKHREETIERSRLRQSTPEYREKLRISNLCSKGRNYKGLNKRPYAGYCELCGKKQDMRLAYHHWNDNKPAMGIWMCNPCHWFVEGIERGLQLKKYLDLKEKIERTAQGFSGEIPV